MSTARNSREPLAEEIVTRWPLVGLVGGMIFVFLVIPLAISMLLEKPEPTARPTVSSARAATSPRITLRPPLERTAPVRSDAREDLRESADLAAPAPVSPIAQDKTDPELVAVAPVEILPARPAAPAPSLASARPDPPQVQRPVPTAAAPVQYDTPASEEAALLLELRSYAISMGLELPVNASAMPLTAPSARYSVPKDKEKSGAGGPHPLLAWAATQEDLASLPFRDADNCQLSAAEAREMQDLSRCYRRAQFLGDRLSGRGNSFSTHPPNRELLQVIKSVGKSQKQTSVPTLVQVAQAEDREVRLELVKALAAIDGPQASAALAQRALFDLSADIRAEAGAALKKRKPEEARAHLLAGLRYPWPPVADHAARALVALEDRAVLPALVDLLDQPDPAAPFLDKNKRWMVREVVRINHFHNCLLCHAASTNRSDPIRGRIPEPGKPIPVEYYESKDGDFVRADVTYLKQDFSLMEFVGDFSPWPAHQRHDYLVRKRPLRTGAEAEPSPPLTGASASYPQREAVLTALRNLTGFDAGARAEEWRARIRPAALPRIPGLNIW